MTTGAELQFGRTRRPVTPEVPTGVCCECGERRKLRRDGSVVMHTRPQLPGELIGIYWCDGGLPAGAR